MRNVYRVLAYLVAIEVVIQAMAIAYGIAGVAHWVEEDGGVLNKQVFDSDDPDFTGIGGFITHGINGMMIIPLLVILLLIVSFFAKVPGGVRFAAIIFGLVALQVFLGIFSHSDPVRRRAARAERLRSSSGRRSPPLAPRRWRRHRLEAPVAV